METVTVGLGEAIFNVVNPNERWQIGYTFKGLAVTMSSVNLMHKKSSSTADNFV